MFKHILILLFLLSFSTFAKVFKVGPGRMYKAPSEVMKLVQDSDTVYIDAGVYDGDAGIWRKNDLLIRGVGGLVHLKAPASLPEKKAIWVVKGNNNVIEYIKFTGAKVPDKNGAGIRFEGTNLTVRHCQFFYNEMGFLTGANTGSTLTFEFCVFGYSGYGDGFSHNIYIGKIKKFVFLYNYTHHAKTGHCIKSRAYENIIMYNRIMDEEDGYSSYLINLPNGGLSYIACNLIMQGPRAENSKLIDYGSEGYKNPVNDLYIYNNTLINKRNLGIFVSVVKGAGKVEIADNIFAGNSAHRDIALPEFADTANNYHETDIEKLHFADEQNYDYRLTANSPVIDMGKNGLEIPGTDNYLEIEYKHPADTAHTVLDGKTDIGAYQFPKESTAIDEFVQSNTNIYYSNGILYLTEKNNSDKTCIEIYNIQGHLIKKLNVDSNSMTVNVGNLPVGVYLYVISNKHNIEKGHFLKY